MLGDIVLVDVDIVAVCVEGRVEDERSIHERTRINQAASLTNLHFLDIKDEASIEDVESHCTLTTKEKDLIVRDLVSKAHVRGNPV